MLRYEHEVAATRLVSVVVPDHLTRQIALSEALEQRHGPRVSSFRIRPTFGRPDRRCVILAQFRCGRVHQLQILGGKGFLFVAAERIDPARPRHQEASP